MRRRIQSPPMGLLGMVALIFLAEAAVARRELDVAGILAWDWRQAVRATSTRAREADVLVFGDSLAKLGVQPRVIEAASGRKVHNLAVSGSHAPMQYELLRRSLEAGARPSAILVDFKMDLLAQDPAVNARHWPEALGVRGAMGLARAIGDRSLFGAMLLARQSPTIRNRLELREAVVGWVRGAPKDPRPHSLSFLRNWRVNRGAQLFPKNPAFKDFDFPAGLKPGTWAPRPVHTVYVDRFLKLAADHKIPVYWLLMPTSPGILAIFEANGDEGRYRAFVARCQAKYPNVTIFDATRAGYAAELFSDPVHLDRDGAAAFSEAVAALLARGPSGTTGGVVRAPRYRPSGVQVVLEDYVQSRGITDVK